MVRGDMRDRFDARRAYLHRSLPAILEEIDPVLRRTDYCLIGGLAVAFHANPPTTTDVDFFVMGKLKDLYKIAAPLKKRGWFFEELIMQKSTASCPDRVLRISKGEDPVPDIVVDLAPAMERLYMAAVVKNSEYATLGSVKVRIAIPEDLVILKTMAGREKDHWDITAIRRAKQGELDEDYIEKTLKVLRRRTAR